MATNSSMRKKRSVRWERLIPAILLLIILIYGLVLVFTHKEPSKSADLPAQNLTSAADPAPTSPAATESSETAPSTEAAEETTEAFQMPTAPAVIPDSVKLDVPYYSQKDLLPTGCELVSAKMLMEFYGTAVDINTIVENTTSVYPKGINGRSYAPTPDRAFIGSPWDETSFGCFPPVIVEMMNKLLLDGTTAVDTTGMELQELCDIYLAQNQPVLIWATISMLETYPGIPWYLLDEEGNTTDEIYYWPANEHCLVLVGYDSQNYYLNDPYGGRGLVTYSRELVETRFADMGKCSVVIVEN